MEHVMMKYVDMFWTTIGEDERFSLTDIES